MNETEMTVVGNLITKADKRRLADGTSVVSFRVASNERRFDRATSSWVSGDTLYLSVTAWRELAEHVHSSMLIGDPIIVRGRIFTSSYVKDGKVHSVTELEASAVGPNLRWSTAVVTRPRRSSEGAGSGAADTGSTPEGGPTADRVTDGPWAPTPGPACSDHNDFCDGEDHDEGTDPAMDRSAVEAGVRG